MEIGKLTGNFKVWNEDCIHPGNKSKNKKEKPDDEYGYPRVPLTQTVDCYRSCCCFIHSLIIECLGESNDAEALSRNKKQWGWR